MSTLVVPIAEVAGFAAFLAGFAGLAVRARKRGSGHSILAPIEEIWDPVAHHTHLEILVQDDRNAPAPAPGDPPVKRLRLRRVPPGQGR